MSRIIYALKCPFTKEIHYIGKSEKGIVRPSKHLKKSHSEKINDWVNSLKIIGHKPEIEILEKVSENVNIDERESYYIRKYLSKGNILLNSILYNSNLVVDKFENHLIENKENNINEISEFIKQRRKALGITQEDFSNRSGVALTVLRKIEQYKTNVNLESLLRLLEMFGYTITIKKNTKKGC